MTFYILPAYKASVENAINKLIATLSVKPTVNYSEVITKEITDEVIDHNIKKSEKYFLDVIEITIDDLKLDDWVLVASVYHKEGIISKVSNEYFKFIPNKFGLNYTKCDHCGKVHSGRNESNIIYNPITNDWKQIGTACINKIFTDGKYLSRFMVKLVNVIQKNGGCSGSNYTTWVKSYKETNNIIQAVNINYLIPIITEYRKNHKQWVKTHYEDGYKVLGSTHHLKDMYYDNNEYTPDQNYNNTIFDFVKNLEAKTDFIADIKESFEAEYVNLYEISKVFFAVKMYEDQFDQADFKEILANKNIVKNDKITITGKIIESRFIDNEEDDYGWNPYSLSYTEYYIKDETTGLTFMTKASNIKKYNIGNDTYKFVSTISGVSYKDNFIYLKGRLSKSPKTAYVA